MKKLAVVMVCVGLMSAAAQAEDNRAARLAAAERLARATPVAKMRDDILTQVAAALPTSERQAFINEMKLLVRSDVIERIGREAMVKTFTAEEMTALAEFYESPQGMSVMKKMPVYMAAVMPAIQQEIQKAMIEAQQKSTRRPGRDS